MFTEPNDNNSSSPYTKHQSFQGVFQDFFGKKKQKQYKQCSRKVPLYGNKFDKYTEQKKKNSTQDEWQNSSSGFSNSKNYDVVGDVLDANTYCWKKQKDSHLDIHEKKVKTAKSHPKNRVCLTEEQQKLFDRVSISQIKQKRKLIDENRKQMEGQYNFMVKKLGHLKRASLLQGLRQRKLSQIKENKRKFSEHLHRSQTRFHRRDERKKLQMKLMIQNHRTNKKQKLFLQHQEKQLLASHQRLNKQVLRQSLVQSSNKLLEEKKNTIQREKVESLKRKNLISRRIEERKQKAKNHFRSKWIKELNGVEKARQEYFSRSQTIKHQMEEAIQIYSSFFDKKQN